MLMQVVDTHPNERQEQPSCRIACMGGRPNANTATSVWNTMTRDHLVVTTLKTGAVMYMMRLSVGAPEADSNNTWSASWAAPRGGWPLGMLKKPKRCRKRSLWTRMAVIPAIPAARSMSGCSVHAWL